MTFATRTMNSIARSAESPMSERTVKNYLRRIFKRLRVANRVELATLAAEQHIGRKE